MPFWLFCLLLSMPQGTVTGHAVPVSFMPLYRAAADFSAGLENDGMERVRGVLESTGDPQEDPDNPERKAARMLLAVHHACQSRPSRARAFFNAFSDGEKLLLAGIFIGKRLLVARPTLPEEPTWIHVDALLGLYRNCQMPGSLFFADFLYENTTVSDIRSALFEWIFGLFTTGDLPAAEDYSGISAYAIRAIRRLRHHWLNEPLPEPDLNAFLELQSRLGLTHPFPSGTPWRISALVPLSGTWAPLGAQMLQALAALREELPALEILVHNTNSSPGTALSLLQEDILLRDRPLAVLLPPDPDSTRILLQSGARVLFLSSGDGSDLPAHDMVFFAQHTRRKRMEALLSAAFSMKATRIGILHPDTAAGKELARAAGQFIQKNQGILTFSVSYAVDKLPNKLNLPKLQETQVVLIPDAAERVAALSRRLAAAGAFPGPLSDKGKGLLLLATAEALTPAIVSQNVRYFSGAIFAPGFYSGTPDPQFDKLSEFFTRMRSPLVLATAAETWWWLRSLPLMAARSGGLPVILRDHIAGMQLGPGLGNAFDSKGRPLRPVRLYRMERGKMVLYP